MDSYYTIRHIIAEHGGCNDDDDDVMDAIVEYSCEHQHFTDKELDQALLSYRLFEAFYPGRKKIGDAVAEQKH